MIFFVMLMGSIKSIMWRWNMTPNIIIDLTNNKKIRLGNKK